jgi:hypothetical protein
MELGKNVHTILSELPSTKRKLMILVNTSKSMDTIKTAEAKFYELQNSLDEQVVLLTTSVHTELVQPTNPS